MKNIEQAKLILGQYISDGKNEIESDGCSLCCGSHGGGKASYKDYPEESSK